MKNVWSFFIISLLLLSCSKEKTFDCVKSTGAVVKEERSFEDFDELLVEDNINIILVQNIPGKVVLEAGKNLLPKIGITKIGRVLTVRNNNTCNWVRNYKVPVNVYVGADQVKKITQHGYGRLTAGEAVVTDTLDLYSIKYAEVDLEIEADHLGFVADDYSTVSLKGKAHKLAGIAFKNAHVNAEMIQVRWWYMQNFSLLDVPLVCDSLLQVKIGGDGHVICTGNPQIGAYEKVGGSGELRLR
jgi:hypothetical protein